MIDVVVPRTDQRRDAQRLARSPLKVAADGPAEAEAEAVAERVTARIGPDAGHVDADGRLPGRLAAALGAEVGCVDHVRVHDDALSELLAASVQARAFTAGRDIHLAAGEGGTHLLAHEATHAVRHPQPAPDVVHAFKDDWAQFQGNPLYAGTGGGGATTQTLQILWKDDHQARAESMAGLLPYAKAGEIDATKPVKIKGLTTLAFWGHGDATQICDKSPAGLVEIVKAWKKRNPGLRTVELITCNSRHYKPTPTGKGTSFANKFKQKLHSGVLSSTKDITVKAMPKSISGKANAWSILLADNPTRSWVYVVAPGATDSELMQAQALIRFTKTATGGYVDYKGDIADRAQQVVANKAATDQWQMLYGHYDDLRNYVVPV